MWKADYASTCPTRCILGLDQTGMPCGISGVPGRDPVTRWAEAGAVGPYAAPR